MRVVIVDYGMGNVKSISGALKYLGVDDIEISSDSRTILASDKIILPGVGAFGTAMLNIQKLSLDKILEEAVIEKKVPILGICLGMQLMGLDSTEDGKNSGLGFLRGHVRKFSVSDLKVPHVGFNQVTWQDNSVLYEGLSNSSDFYFTHSFKMSVADGVTHAICNYGEPFVASYEVDNIAGVQFHPELSQKNGLKLLNNFLSNF
jgi:imidazole glycerol-phosphate synthase subunit HisH